MNTNDVPKLDETEYLLRSPKNAERLLAALAWSEAGEGVPQTVEELRAEFGLEEDDNDSNKDIN